MPMTAIPTRAAASPGAADRLESVIDRPHTLEAFASTVAHVAVCVLIAAAPFELTRPFVQLPHQSISDSEAIMVAAVLAFGAALAWSRQWWPIWRTPVTAPWLLLIAIMSISAAVAPINKFNAFHMAGRFAAAFVICLLAINATTTAARLRRTLIVALASGTVVALLAILESLQVPFVLDMLRAFRPGVFVVGAQLRAGGTLQYPTIASMYLEIIFAFGLGLLLADLEARRRRSAIGIGVALLLIAEAIILTFTRAGLIAMFASIACVAWWRFRQQDRESGAGHRIATRAMLVLAALIVVQFVASRPAQNLWLRLTTEEQTGWYRSAITAPTELSLAPGELRGIPIHITNTGRMGWDSTASPPFYLSYHWLSADATQVVSYDGARTAFEHPIAPGESVDMKGAVRAPNHPGQYLLAWDVVQEGQLWFSTEVGSVSTYSNAVVAGDLATANKKFNGPLVMTALPKHTDRPGRGVLWMAALRLLVSHPLLGVGPDNYRLMYGPAAGLKDADTRVHSNNMYIEVLVGSGLLGALAFAWLLWRLGVAAVSAVRMPTLGRWSPPILGVAAAVVAIALHGFVDCFVGFTPTYVTIALTLGLLVAGAARADSGNTHAHRV
jgi:hypothetical protein